MRTSFIRLAFLLAIICFSSFSGLSQPVTFTSTGIGGGGALYSPKFSPFDNDEIFMACDMGELFHSTALGTDWSPVHFSEFIAMPQAQVQFTSNPDILYCLGSNGFGSSGFKSTDGGTTWTPLTNDPTFNDAYYLYADPNDTERILITGYSELFFSNDGGNSFTSVYSAADLYIGGVFWDGVNIFVGCRTGLVVSTDNGLTFNDFDAGGALPTNYGFLSLAGAKQATTIRLVGVARSNANMWPWMQGSEFWADQDVFVLEWGDAVGWQIKSNGIPTDDFPFFVSMPLNDINTIYIGGATEYPVFPAVYKTSDGGDNWANVFQVINNANIATGWQGNGGDENWWWGGNAMGFSVSPNNPDRAIITDFGFAHLTTDGGTTWQQLYVDPADQNSIGDTNNEGQYYHSIGLENTSCWWLHWLDADHIFAGYSDITGIRSQDSGESWSFDYTGNDYNTTYCVVQHPNSGTLYAGTSTVHDMYQSTRLQDNILDSGNGEVLYSTDDGASWQTLHDFSNSVIWLAIDPNNVNRMYASVIHSTDGDIYVTNNLNMGVAATWTRLASPPRTEGHPYNIHVLDDGRLLCTYSGRRDGGGAFTTSSGVFVSNDGGTNWIDLSIPEMERWTKDITIDPHDPTQNTWYASVFSHWGAWPNEVGGLYKTTNAGATWVEIDDWYRVESCTISPTNPDEIYITTETEGLWYSGNFTDVNPTFSLLMEYPFMHPQRVFYNPYDNNEVWITSFGHGLRVGNSSTPTVVVQVKTLLEGAYEAATMDMRTDLRTDDLIPLSQPFNRLPWNYTGMESVATLADMPTNVVDWVLVEVRDATDNYTIIEQSAAFLLNDGSVVDVDGVTNGVNFFNLNTGNDYDLSIKTRNHLALLSSNTTNLPNTVPYDFTIPSNVFGGTLQLTDLGSGIYGQKAGDIDSNGTLTVADFNEYIADAALINVYIDADCNMDKFVTVSDFNLYEPNSSVIGAAQIRY